MILQKASIKKEFNLLVFLRELGDCENQDFSQLWSAKLSDFEKKSALNREDISLLKSFGDKLGTTDSLHQTQLCDEYICRFEERYENEKSNV